jgi:hypothetical protein
MKLSIETIAQVKSLYKDALASGSTSREIKLEGRTYEVMGEKRLTVRDITPKGEGKRASKEPKAPVQDVDKKCVVCGETFTCSRFTPYFDKCLQHRKGADTGKAEARECDTCGKSFKPSRFNPYLTTCPGCRDAAKKEARAKVAKKAKESA